MTPRLTRLRPRFSYGNVTATLALFVALGGTGYAAITLPKNSVGAKQIRARAVASSEIKNNAIKLRDISRSARSTLGGRPGPPGPQGPAGTPAIGEHVQVNSGGGSNGTGVVSHPDGSSNVYTVEFKRDVSACGYSATLAAAQNGPVLEEPPAGRITVASAGGGRVTVKTFDAAGSAVPEPFHLLVAC